MELGPWSNAYTGKDQYCDTDIVYKLDFLLSIVHYIWSHQVKSGHYHTPGNWGINTKLTHLRSKYRFFAFLIPRRHWQPGHGGGHLLSTRMLACLAA